MSHAADPGFSGGSPLGPSTRSRMEGAFGRSFDGVRVHTDARAAGFAAEHQAEAVTTGQDIAFGTSKYRPGTEGGDRLLAHELTHVVQQGNSARGAPQAKSEVSTPNEPAEMQADAAASRVLSGHPAGVTEGSYSGSTRNRLMRKALSPASVPVPGNAAETAGPTEAKSTNGPEVTGGPPGKKRKKPEEAEAAEAGKEQAKTPGEEGAGAEAKTAEGRQAGVEEPASTRKMQDGKQGARAAVGGGLAGRLAQSLREKVTRGEEKPALSPGANETLREAAESGATGAKKEQGKAGEARAAGLQAPEGMAAGEVARLRGTKPAGGTLSETTPAAAKAGGAGRELGALVEGKTGVAGKEPGATAEGIAGVAGKEPGAPVEGKAGVAGKEPGAPVEGKAGVAGKAPEAPVEGKAGAAGKEPGAPVEGKAGVAGKAPEAPVEGKAGAAGKEPGAPGEGKAEGRKGAEAEGAATGEKGAEKKPGAPDEAKALAGEKEEGTKKGKGGDASAKAEGQAKARHGVPGDVKKALEGANEKGPAGASPATAEREPAAAGGGGGGGGGAGGEGGSESPEAQATEEKIDEKQPEEEAAAEAQQDQEETAEGEAGGGGEAEAEGGGGSEPAEALSGGGGGEGDTEPTSVDAAEKGPTEQQVEAKEAASTAETNREIAEQKQADAEEAQAQEPAPESAGPEEGALSPAEQGAATASVSEDAGGGAGAAAGGGGGGGAIPDKPAPAVPDVSGSEPKAGLGSLKGLAPMSIQGALGSVSQSVSKSVGDKKQALAANPPTRAASSGMPGKKGATRLDLGADGKGGTKAEKVNEGAAVETPAAEPVPEAPAPAVNAVTAPTTSGTGEGEMSQQDADRMGSAVDNMPTSDPEVSTSAGPPPTLALEGNADPTQVTAQRVKMDQSVAAAHDTGKVDARKPMGENEIAPQETHETLAAQVPASGGGAGGGAGGPGGPDAEAASIIAQEKSQAEIDAAVEKGQGDMAQEEAKEQEASEAETQRTQDLAAQAESDAAAEQEAEKAAAQNEVAKKRGEWNEEQQAAVDKSHTEADTKQQEAEEKVETEKTQADESAGKTIHEGEEKAQQAKEEGEAKAEREKAKAKEESSGFFGWLASKAKAFFNKIKEAVKSVMKALRAAVKAAIEAAKKAAVALIEKARQAVVAAIRLAGDALIAISDVALAAFPELKAKFQGAVRQTVQDAEDAVNNIADKLKKGVTKLLDALGEFLDKALGLLEKGLLAAVDAVAAVVDSAIKAAEAVAKALGTFLALIKDIAADPGQWIANLGAAVVDGIKNHLVKAMASAISDWFKSKVEEVLGIPIDLMKALFTGGFNLEAIGKMAWEALKSAVPGILVQLLIEKLVAMIVPAAGAVMAIIEGVQAAWGAVSRIIAAIDSFITFLKAVKGGNAGPPFATAVAAGAVAVIDFVANWLLKRLMKPAKKVSGKLAALGKKILAKIKKGLKKAGKKLKKFFKKAGQKLKKLKDKVFGKKKKGKGRDKKKDKDKKKKEQIEKALREVPPKVRALVAKRPRKLMLTMQLLKLKVQYRLKKLAVSGTRPNYTISGFINPPLPDEKIFGVDSHKFLKAVQLVAQKWAKRRKAEERAPDQDLMAMPQFGVETRGFGKGGVHSPGMAGAEPVSFETKGSLTLIPGVEKPRSYLAITNELEKLSAEDRDKFGTMLAQLVKRKRADANVAGLGEVFGTMFVSERKRHSKNLVYALMAVQTMAAGGASPVEMLNPKQGEGGGIFPPAYKGAVQGQGGTSRLGNNPTQAALDQWSAKETQKQAKLPEYRRTDPEQTFAEAYRREVEQIKRWAKAAGLEEKIFNKDMSPQEIADIIDAALASYFSKG
ncbi:eCIS core domain-containing protein [Corallococcus sp. M7]